MWQCGDDTASHRAFWSEFNSQDWGFNPWNQWSRMRDQFESSVWRTLIKVWPWEGRRPSYQFAQGMLQMNEHIPGFKITYQEESAQTISCASTQQEHRSWNRWIWSWIHILDWIKVFKEHCSCDVYLNKWM